MGRQYQSGDRVRVESGEHTGKFGIVLARRSITYTHGRMGSIPQIEGADGPLRFHDQLVRLDNGRTVVIPGDQLSEIVGGEYPLTLRVA